MLDLPSPAIYSRADYGLQVHVVAVEKPVLLAGPELISCESKVELAFRLGRAMSYLRPGRAVAAGSPTHVLKSAMMACYSIRSPDAAIADPDGLIAAFKSSLLGEDPDLRYEMGELVSHISQQHPSLNLSRWVRSLDRSADRVGLLLCGDLVRSIQYLADAAPESRAPLLAFALSPEHMQLRRSLGLSIEV